MDQQERNASIESERIVKSPEAFVQPMESFADFTVGNTKMEEEVRASVAACVASIQDYDSRKRYALALKECDSLERILKNVSDICPASVLAQTRETAPWLKAMVLKHWAEDRISLGLPPFEDDGLEEFENLIEKLPIHNRQEIYKESLRDRALGYRFVEEGMKLTATSEDAISQLSKAFRLLDSVSESNRPLSKTTKQRMLFLRLATQTKYNELATIYFNKRREYKGAQELFADRNRFQKSEIAHADYRDAIDERDFRIRFLKKEADVQNDEAFAISVAAFVKSIQGPEEAELEILAHYFMITNLSENKRASLYSAISSLSFEKLLWLLSWALRIKTSQDSQSMVFHAMVEKREKTLNLEVSANSLKICKENLEKSSFHDAFETLLEDVLRSPRARKICEKSYEPALHVLRGEDELGFPLPWGKKTRHVAVRPWSFTFKGLYLFFCIVLPIIASVIVGVVLCIALQDKRILKYVLIAPSAVMLLAVYFAITARHGIDERASARLRHILYLVGTLLSGVGAVFFALPSSSVVLAEIMASMVFTSFVCAMLALLGLRDKKRSVSIALEISWAIAFCIAIVFVVIGVYNGSIVML